MEIMIKKDGDNTAEAAVGWATARKPRQANYYCRRRGRPTAAEAAAGHKLARKPRQATNEHVSVSVSLLVLSLLSLPLALSVSLSVSLSLSHLCLSLSLSLSHNLCSWELAPCSRASGPLFFSFF